MTDLSKIKDGAFENGIQEDTDFDQFEARSLARDYGLAEAIEAAEYAEAGLEVPRQLEVIESEILFYKAQAGGAILEIGRRLLEAKEQVPHGQWETWLAEKVDFSVRSAQRFMKLAKGYGESDTVSLFGARKALVLLALEDSERSDFVAENDVENMTAKELEELVRLRRELQEANVKNERLEDKLKVKESKLTAADVELEKARADVQTAEDARRKMAEDMKLVKANLKDQQAEAEKYKTAADKIGKELADLKEKPVDVAVREPTEEEIAALAAPAVEAVRAKSQEELRQLEKKLAAADPDTAAFKVLFEGWQETYDKMAAALGRVARMDPGKAEKLKGAVRAALERMSV